MRRQQLANGQPVLERIFKAFRTERAHDNGNALATLQDQLAENAPQLIGANLIDLKTLIATIQSLESARKPGDEGANVEERLANFLRGEEPEETQPEGAIQ